MISPPTTSKIPNLVEVMDAIIRAGEKIQDIYNTEIVKHENGLLVTNGFIHDVVVSKISEL